MAEKPVTLVISNTGVMIATWTDLDVGDTGAPVEAAAYPDKTVQCVGTGTAIPMEGSNDGTNWAPLNDFAGVAISLDGTTAASSMQAIRENPLYIRPGTVVGGANSSVIMVGKAR